MLSQVTPVSQITPFYDTDQAEILNGMLRSCNCSQQHVLNESLVFNQFFILKPQR